MDQRRWIGCALVALWITGGPILVAQRFEPWQHFTSRSGLPQNTVLDMELDQAGYLWIATEGGLVRFDGRTFLPFQLPTKNEPASQRMRQVMLTVEGEVLIDDAEGNLYGTHASQVVFPILRASKRLQIQGSVPSAAILTYFRDPREAGTRPAPWRELHATWYPSGIQDWSVITRKACYHFKDTSLVAEVPLEQTLETTWSFDGRTYGCDGSGGFYRLDPANGAVTEVPNIGAPIGLRSVLNPEGRVFWHVGDPFIHVLHLKHLYRIEENGSGGLRTTLVDIDLSQVGGVRELLYMPGSGSLYVGTLTNGLYAFRPFDMRTVPCSTLLEQGSSLYAQGQFADGSLLVAGQAREIYTIKEGQCTPFPGLDHSNKFNFGRDPQGNIWVLTSGDLVRLSADTKRSDTIIVGIGPEITMLFEGDSLLYATNTDLFSYRNGRVRPLAHFNFIREVDRAVVLRRGLDGRLLIGTFYGLYQQDPINGSQFAPIPEFNGVCVRALDIIDGLLLIGTYGGGAYIRTGDRTVQFPMDPWRSLTHAHTFVKDLKDHLWISTNQGLLRTTVQDIRAYLHDPQDRPFFALYGASSGLTSWEMNGGCDPASLRLTDGRLSFPTMGGLLQFVPEEIRDPFPAMDILPGQVLVNGEPWKIDKHLIVPNDVQEISIGFGFPYWGDPINAALEYRIPGIIDAWTDLDPLADRIAVVRPPSGEFEVYVRRVGSTARQLSTEPILWFKVRKPFYRTWPAILLYLLGTIGLVVIGVKLNSIRLRNRNKWLEENVRMKTDALNTSNSELRSTLDHQEKLISIIAHDVVPPLRFVARVAQSAEQLHRLGKDHEALGETLHDLNSSTHKLFDNANNLLAWIKSRSRHSGPEFRTIAIHAFVENAMERIREMAESSGITLHNSTDPEELLVTDGDLLGIVLYNNLVNAKLHAQATRIRVSGAAHHDHYRLCIDDDGQGIAPGTLARIREELSPEAQGTDTERRSAAVGLGYLIIAECARSLGCRIQLESSEKGTSIALLFPLHPAPTRPLQR